MSMSTHIVGFTPPDREWHLKLAAWKACREAGVAPGHELCKYFGLDLGEEQDPDPNGHEVEIPDAKRDWTDGDMCSGIQVDLLVLARQYPNVKVLRFYNSR